MVLRHPTLSKVQALEEEMKGLPTAPWSEFHHFDHGVYQRGVMIPAGTVVTGKIHRHRNMLVLVKGTCLFVGEGEPVRVEAPFATINPPGTKRAVFAITDCVLISYVVTDLTDPDEVAAQVVVDTPEQLLIPPEQMPCRLSQPHP